MSGLLFGVFIIFPFGLLIIFIVQIMIYVPNIWLVFCTKFSTFNLNKCLVGNAVLVKGQACKIRIR